MHQKKIKQQNKTNTYFWDNITRKKKKNIQNKPNKKQLEKKEKLIK